MITWQEFLAGHEKRTILGIILVEGLYCLIQEDYEKWVGRPVPGVNIVKVSHGLALLNPRRHKLYKRLKHRES